MLESIENLDKILANIGTNQKEKVIESMAIKFRLFDYDQANEPNLGYANR